jgi:hypothetical protein
VSPSEIFESSTSVRDTALLSSQPRLRPWQVGMLFSYGTGMLMGSRRKWSISGRASRQLIRPSSSQQGCQHTTITVSKEVYQSTHIGQRIDLKQSLNGGRRPLSFLGHPSLVVDGGREMSAQNVLLR